MIRSILTFILVLISSAANALDSVSLDVGSVEASGWKLTGIQIAITDLANNRQKLTLTIDQLSLPKPFDDLSLINIYCSSFTWQNQELLCTQGHARMRSQRWQSPAVNFSFHIRAKQSSIKLSDLHLAGGTISIDAEERGNQWLIQMHAKAIKAREIHKLLALPTGFELKDGRVNFTLTASGSYSLIEYFTLTTELDDLTGQTRDGRYATEALVLNAKLDAQNNKGVWQWKSHSRVKAGAAYIEPLYLEAGGQPVVFEAQGNWNDKLNRAEINYASFKQASVLALSGSAIVHYDKNLKLEKADLSLQSDDLQKLSAQYLNPFIEQTALEGISFAGTINADFSIVQGALTALTATVNRLTVKDTAGRISLEGAFGAINWSDAATFTKSSTLSWQQLHIFALPIGASRFSFLSRGSSFKLLEKTRLPFLGGVIAINQLGWQATKQQEPEIYFAGSLNNISLEQWSDALNWTPLSGTISGNIPRVDYRNKTLSLGGELLIKVFDGSIKITKLASSGLFSDFPKLYSELEINNLDLDQLTGKFKFGGITGKLSGYVRQLTMENWHPVTFFAWIGTPDDDDSRHRISQKAVKNIASIAGGSASDILSRSVLSIFETFGYDKIGVGCYLHNGVCQLMGVEARPQGYAIITGGGLPRIEVIGYNPRVDWNVLMERLSRISTADEAIIK